MDSYQSRLRPDGTVFPPVTPDPPPLPGESAIEVPDIVAGSPTAAAAESPDDDPAEGVDGSALVDE